MFSKPRLYFSPRQIQRRMTWLKKGQFKLFWSEHTWWVKNRLKMGPFRLERAMGSSQTTFIYPASQSFGVKIVRSVSTARLFTFFAGQIGFSRLGIVLMSGHIVRVIHGPVSQIVKLSVFIIYRSFCCQLRRPPAAESIVFTLQLQTMQTRSWAIVKIVSLQNFNHTFLAVIKSNCMLELSLLA